MKDINFLTVEKLHQICTQMILDDKGDYRVYLATGGYYDGYVFDELNYINDNDKELILGN